MREFVRDNLIAGSVDLAVDTESCPIISLICSGGNLSVVLAIIGMHQQTTKTQV